MPSFILSSNCSDFITVHESLHLDPNKTYEAAFLSLESYNSIPNIIEGQNNILKYSIDDGFSWKTITLNTGAYELSGINNEIKRQMIVNGDDDSAINITANISRLTAIVSIENPRYHVDFTDGNSLASLLGFDKIVLGFGYNEGTSIVNIMPVNSILVNVDFIMGSFVNGRQSPALYCFHPNVSPGYKIVERPNPTLIYYPLSRHDISRIRLWLTDQDGNLIDLRGETITVRIHVRQTNSVFEEVSKISQLISKLNI